MNNPECPSCGKSYPTEDFCPVHNIPLVVPKVEDESEVISDEDKPSLASGDKVSNFMSRLGLHHTNQEKHDDVHQLNPEVVLLPEEIVDAGWKITGVIFTSGGLDIWPIERDDSGEVEKGFYNRFRTPALTSQNTYDLVKSVSLTSLPKLVSNGTIDLGGARTDFEVVSAVHSGVMLDKWLVESAPSEERAKSLLEPLSVF